MISSISIVSQKNKEHPTISMPSQISISRLQQKIPSIKRTSTGTKAGRLLPEAEIGKEVDEWLPNNELFAMRRMDGNEKKSSPDISVAHCTLTGVLLFNCSTLAILLQSHEKISLKPHFNRLEPYFNMTNCNWPKLSRMIE